MRDICKKYIETYLSRYTNHLELIEMIGSGDSGQWIKCRVLGINHKSIYDVYFRVTFPDAVIVEYGVMRDERIIIVDTKIFNNKKSKR